MARRKKGSPVHGWLVLDKPQGRTSTQALGAAKRIFNAQKAGHAGTLDPLATGILPIAFGEATKTVTYAVDGEKSYRFVVRWGEERTTDDAEGEVVERSDVRPSRDEIEEILPRFVGEILQTPPQFSAVKVDGNRAYDLAREGETVKLEARPVVIDALHLAGVPNNHTAVFEADCSKGTYVRALARDMGRLLGSFGHVIELRRTRVGPFTEDDAASLEELEAAASGEGDVVGLDQFLLPVEAALHGLTGLQVSSSDAASLARGQPVLIRGRDAPVLTGPAYAECKGRLIALGEIEKGALHPTRVFNLS